MESADRDRVQPPLLRPVHDAAAELAFFFDGVPLQGRAGDTVIAALLRLGKTLGRNEFDGAPRAGFCLMGSCQECSLWDGEGRRLRACMTQLTGGMALFSEPLRPDKRE